MQIRLPENVEFILNRLEANGFRADIVGGPVRDFLLGKIPDDYDITTSASPSEIKNIFSDVRTVDTGIKHGTVSIILGGEQYEVTTYRIDGEYKDSRHPESVIFTTNIEEDLRRRDFTMNAIAYSPSHGITDCYGGREDAMAGIIRAVGEPEIRFTEDALRILRGVRFSATLGFTVEENTRLAMMKTHHLLANVSVERIYVELRKALSGNHSYDAISTFSEIILGVIPELSGLVLPDKSRYERADYVSRLIAIFYLNSKTPKESFAEAMARLHTDSHIREVGACVFPLIEKAVTDSDKGLNYILRDIGEECAKTLVDIRVLLGYSREDAGIKLSKLIENGAVYKLSQLKINGKQLLSLGAKGRQVGTMLDALLTDVIEGKIENEEEALLSAAKLGLSSLKNTNLI